MEKFTRTRAKWAEVLSAITCGHIVDNIRESMYDSGHGQMARLKALGVWKEGDRILDLACGNGRFAIPLTEVSVEYDGIDCLEGCVAFCQKAFEPWKDRMRFIHQDVWNGFYNPTGTIPPERTILPFDAEVFDSVIASSFMTHVGTPEACRNYLSEILRVLKRGGKAWLTWFRSPPNEVRYHCDRTAFREADIIRWLEHFRVNYTHCGLTDSQHDQWEMVLAVP